MANANYLPTSFITAETDIRSVAWDDYSLDKLDPLSYEIVLGSDPSIAFNPSHLVRRETTESLSRPGQLLHGYYSFSGQNDIKYIYPVISFRYNKGDEPGGEQLHRLIVLTGIGAGTFRNHLNLPACETVIGPQIGTYNPQTETFSMEQPGARIDSKHFPVICYYGGPLGEQPLSANPWPAVGC